MRLFLNDFQTLAYFESPVLSKWKFLKGVTICLERAATQFRYFLQSVNFEGPLSGLCAGHRSKKEVLSSTTTTVLC